MITYAPDSAGRQASAIDAGNSINYVTGATGPGSNVIYAPDGSPLAYTNGWAGSFAGIANNFSYNKREQPVLVSAASPGQTVFSLNYDFHLGNGDNGNVFGVTNNRDTSRNQTFTYDTLNRLASAQNAGTDCSQKTVNGATRFWGNSYGYDPWGNLLSKSATKCTPEHLSVSALTNNQLVGYTYDAAGNMTHDATTGNNYSYDPENRITGAAGFAYTYDAEGNRVEKSNGSTGTIYWYMSPGIVAESDLKGNLTSEYIFFDGERVARKDFSGSTTSVSYYFSDHLKTASVITDPLGNIKEDEDFYPWGGELQFVNNDSNHYKHNGKERDAETGLDYYGARHYSSSLSRFITPDWSSVPVPVPYADLANPQTLNQYAFAHNNPTSLDDPDGHDPPGDGQAVGTLAKAAIGCAAVEPCGAGMAVVGIVAAPVLGMVVAVSVEPIALDGGCGGGDCASYYIPPPPVSNPAPGTQTQTGPYDVGSAADLKGGSVVGDGLDVHHVPQQQPAGQVIGGYDGKTAPAIATPKDEHKAIPTDKGTATRTPRDQLAKDVRDLRNKTKAPNSKIKELIKKNKEQYPEMNKPKPESKRTAD